MIPVSGKITSPFGFRTHPVTKKSSFHNGVDIACAVGTPVRAPGDGRVVDVWQDVKGGLSLAMVTPDGFRYGFAHLQRRLVHEGQEVKEGDVIALSGNSGIGTGPHLHFTVKKNGVAVDPEKFLTTQQRTKNKEQ